MDCLLAMNLGKKLNESYRDYFLRQLCINKKYVYMDIFKECDINSIQGITLSERIEKIESKKRKYDTI